MASGLKPHGLKYFLISKFSTKRQIFPYSLPPTVSPVLILILCPLVLCLFSFCFSSLCVFSHPFCSGVQEPGGRGGGEEGDFSSRVACRATLSWGKDDRKSARWHRAGLQHVTSSLERQEARRKGRSDEEEEGV